MPPGICPLLQQGAWHALTDDISQGVGERVCIEKTCTQTESSPGLYSTKAEHGQPMIRCPKTRHKD